MIHAFPARVVLCALFAAAIFPVPSHGQEQEKDASSSQEYLDLVRSYADAMLDQARDTYGEQHTPLFAAALDQHSMALLEGEALEAVVALERTETGIRQHDRALSGANPMHDENLYQILYALSEITGDARYAQAADEALEYFFTHGQSEATGLFAWGEHIGWDFRTEQRIEKPANNTHEYFRPWVLWDKSFALAPEASARFARGVWEHQIGDHETGNFSRHAQYDAHGPGKNSEYPRHGGFYIATWAAAYKHTQDDAFLKHIEKLVDYFDGRRHPETHALPSESAERSKNTRLWPPSNISLAVDLEESAKLVPEGLAEKLRASASTTDDVFLKLPHDLSADGKGFVDFADTATLGGEACTYTDLWGSGYGDYTSAQVADICLLRYDQTEREGYRVLIVAAAGQYLKSEPDRSKHLYPGTFGDVIHHLLGAHRLTGEGRYLDRARYFAGMACEIFLDDSALPRATSKTIHYEAITRGDTLMMSLLELWCVENGRDCARQLVYADR